MLKKIEQLFIIFWFNPLRPPPLSFLPSILRKFFRKNSGSFGKKLFTYIDISIINWGKQKYTFIYRPSLKNGSDQLIVAQYNLSIYPSVQNQMIRTIFKAHVVS